MQQSLKNYRQCPHTIMASGLLGQIIANAFVASGFLSSKPNNFPQPIKCIKDLHFEKHREVLNLLLKRQITVSRKMAVTKNGFLVGLLAFLCLSLSAANRVLKDNDSENESISDSLAELKRSVPKDSVPKFSSVGPTNGDCCSYGKNCGVYACPPDYGCGGNCGCQSRHSCSSCSWQGCQGCQGSPCQECQGSPCQGCQGSPPPCERLVDNNTKVQHESGEMPELVTANVVPPVQPVKRVKSPNGEENQDINSIGGLV